MDAPTRVYLDANVFIRAFEGTDSLAHQLVGMIASEEASSSLATSELTLAEVLVVPYRQQRSGLAEVYENWILPGGRLLIGPVTRDVLTHAAALRAQNRSLKLPDAIHLATAIGMECSHFLTFDGRLHDAYESVTSRHGIAAASANIVVVTPDDTFLRLLRPQERE